MLVFGRFFQFCLNYSGTTKVWITIAFFRVFLDFLVGGAQFFPFECVRRGHFATMWPHNRSPRTLDHWVTPMAPMTPMGAMGVTPARKSQEFTQIDSYRHLSSNIEQ